MRRDATIRVLLLLILAVRASSSLAAERDGLEIASPLTPPAWALLEREVLRASTRACLEFFDRYFDDRGYLECVERWGGDDGPDDAIENLAGWPVLHALGAPDTILERYKKAWEGHIRQYTRARTTEVEFARGGMYYKEFPVKFDWVHNGEGLRVFNLQGLSDPKDLRFHDRVLRFAGFYMNEDPGAPNYDSEHKVIRSLFNGSRGPLLRKARPVEWAGDPIEVEGRFRPGHGERSYGEMLAHFKDYGDVVGDHPQNLLATTLALNAFMLTHEAKYRSWLLEYVDAWRRRTVENGGIIPTNVGLDGTIGGAAGGKWYGGVYGWGFTVLDPSSGRRVHRNTHDLGVFGFGNAYLLTGDDRYLDVWRKQVDQINRQKKVVDGRTLYPHMYGPDGWYDYTGQKYDRGTLELWYWSMKPEDRAVVPTSGWLRYLEGQDPGYPEQALRADLSTLRRKVQGMRSDPTTPDTRLSDDPMANNPAVVGTLTNLMLGGLEPGRSGSVLYCRLRYFDPAKRRAGLPEDVAALVDSLSAGETALTLVNLNPSDRASVVIQGGGYGEHQIESLEIDGRSLAVNRPYCTVDLAPGSGGRLLIKMHRYRNQPTLAMPWDRE